MDNRGSCSPNEETAIDEAQIFVVESLEAAMHDKKAEDDECVKKRWADYFSRIDR